jgi:hypothetical protein
MTQNNKQGTISRVGEFIANLMPANTMTATRQATPAPQPLPGTPAFTQTVQPTQPNAPRPVPQAWQPVIQAMYKQYPNLPRGVIEATLMQESSMGTNPAAYHPQNGESAWIAGITPAATQHLTQRGIKTDQNTQAGAIETAAHYLGTRQSGVDDKGKPFTYNDPSKLYFERYKTNSADSLPATTTARNNFKTYFDYYSKQPRDFNNLTSTQ